MSLINEYPFEVDDSVHVACCILEISDLNLVNLLTAIILSGQDVASTSESLNIDLELAKKTLRNVQFVLNDDIFKISGPRLNRFSVGSLELNQLRDRIKLFMI